MTCQLIPIELTAEQQGQVYGILSVGCDRETAANYIGCSLADLVRAMRQDAEFGASVRRTEAATELSHMRTVQNAAKDEKNWRASVWWLERRSPERYGSRSAGAVTTRHLKAYLTIVGESLHNDIRNAEDRERVMARFKQFQTLVDDMTDDVCGTALNLDEDSSSIEQFAEYNDDLLAGDDPSEFIL